MSEIRIASIGNVDSAKSTTIACISNNILDNGKGVARKRMFRHRHEKDTGRTSSISQYYIKHKDKTFGFVDLAGHEKYLKTTVSGLSGCFIDYAMVTIGVDRGIIGMTKEHMGIAISLHIPLFIVITKMDIAQKHKKDKMLNRLLKMMNSKACNYKKCKIIDETTDIHILDNWVEDNICPIFLVSNVSGYNLKNLKEFIYGFNQRIKWELDTRDKKFLLEDVFNVKGIGVVLSGLSNRGDIWLGDILYLGPFSGVFKKVVVRSIHNNFEENIDVLHTGKFGYVNVRPIHKKDSFTKQQIKKGMVMISTPNCIRTFEADVLILKHSTTIKQKYQPIIHCGYIRQAAEIYKMDKDYLRTGDTAKIQFKFMFHPEYIELGSKIIFREGITKGLGEITNISPVDTI